MSPRAARRPTLTLAPLLAALFVGLQAPPSFAQKPGTEERTMSSAGKAREFLLHIPRSYKKKQKELMPLVVMLHGRTGNGALASSPYYGWKRLADKEDFVVVFPTALGSPTSWQGAWKGEPTDDSTFLSELIDLMLEELKVDPDRVFMTGHSSGAFMSYSFATSHAKKVAAIGPVAGLVISQAKPSEPVAVISFHGMSDSVVPYGKNNKWGTPSAVESAALFARHAGCEEAVRTELGDGAVHLDTWAEGGEGTEVRLYSIEGGGHGWPQKGKKSVAATELIWEFFKAHPRGGLKKKGKRG